MIKRKKLWVTAGLCLLVALGLRSCILSFTNPGRWRVGGIAIPASRMTLSLWAGSMQEALIQPYDGVHLILEVTQSNLPAQYYDLPPAGNQDHCRMEVYWYPTNKLIRLRDAGANAAYEFQPEFLIDLNQRILFSVFRGNGLTHILQRSSALSELAFPQSRSEVRVETFQVGRASELGAGPLEYVSIGRHTSRETTDYWTTNAGALAGVITPE